MDNAAAAAWDKLSESLPYGRTPGYCQACGLCDPESTALWMEHDMLDKPTGTLLVLCRACSKKLIDPHPRLYAEQARNAPQPGAMGICVECTHRHELGCTHPQAKHNGGPGLKLAIETPGRAHVQTRGKNGRREGYFMTIYPSPAKHCTGKTPP